MVSALRIEFRESIVKEEEWRVACAIGEQFNLREEEGEEEAALLAARGDGCQIASAGMKGKIVSVWANKRVSLIPLAFRCFIKRLA